MLIKSKCLAAIDGCDSRMTGKLLGHKVKQIEQQ